MKKAYTDPVISEHGIISNRFLIERPFTLMIIYFLFAKYHFNVIFFICRNYLCWTNI